MTESELLALRAKAHARLSDALGSTPLPSYKIDGREFKWNEYIKTLQELIKNIDEQLAGLPAQEITVYLDPALEE